MTQQDRSRRIKRHRENKKALSLPELEEELKKTEEQGIVMEWNRAVQYVIKQKLGGEAIQGKASRLMEKGKTLERLFRTYKEKLTDLYFARKEKFLDFKDQETRQAAERSFRNHRSVIDDSIREDRADFEEIVNVYHEHRQGELVEALRELKQIEGKKKAEFIDKRIEHYGVLDEYAIVDPLENGVRVVDVFRGVRNRITRLNKEVQRMIEAEEVGIIDRGKNKDLVNWYRAVGELNATVGRWRHRVDRVGSVKEERAKQMMFGIVAELGRVLKRHEEEHHRRYEALITRFGDEIKLLTQLGLERAIKEKVEAEEHRRAKEERQRRRTELQNRNIGEVLGDSSQAEEVGRERESSEIVETRASLEAQVREEVETSLREKIATSVQVQVQLEEPIDHSMEQSKRHAYAILAQRIEREKGVHRENLIQVQRLLEQAFEEVKVLERANSIWQGLKDELKSELEGDNRRFWVETIRLFQEKVEAFKELATQLLLELEDTERDVLSERVISQIGLLEEASKRCKDVGNQVGVPAKMLKKLTQEEYQAGQGLKGVLAGIETARSEVKKYFERGEYVAPSPVSRQDSREGEGVRTKPVTSVVRAKPERQQRTRGSMATRLRSVTRQTRMLVISA